MYISKLLRCLLAFYTFGVTDNSSAGSEPTGALDINEAANAFENILNPVEETEKPEAETVEVESAEPESEEEATQEGEPITVEVDGKMVTLTPAQVAEAYKSGLRQADYSRKTMEVAEERRVAEAASEKAAQEREVLAHKLNAYTMQLHGALEEQSKINWQELLDSDPVEYLKQQHLFQQRQAQLNQAQQDQQYLSQVQQQEQAAAMTKYLNAQQQELIAKLPAWKDEAKAKAEKSEIKDFLKAEGFTDEAISQVADHRHVLLIRDAMQFRKLLKQAPDATKRVEKTPVKVERPGVADKGNLDGRTAVMKKFAKTGSVEDAGAVFASLL